MCRVEIEISRAGFNDVMVRSWDNWVGSYIFFVVKKEWWAGALLCHLKFSGWWLYWLYRICQTLVFQVSNVLCEKVLCSHVFQWLQPPSGPFKWIWKSKCTTQREVFAWLLPMDRLDTKKGRNISRTKNLLQGTNRCLPVECDKMVTPCTCSVGLLNWFTPRCWIGQKKKKLRVVSLQGDVLQFLTDMHFTRKIKKCEVRGVEKDEK